MNMQKLKLDCSSIQFSFISMLTYIFITVIIIFGYANADQLPPKLVNSNIAYEKSYTLSVPPNYPLCTDLGDSTQLTDGEYTEGYFWTKATTVGWKKITPIEITIDLVQNSPIKGVSFRTAAKNTAGVEWPRAISVLVSEDGKNYYSVGELIRLSNEHSAPSNDETPHTFWTDQLVTHGRYVKFVVDNYPYTFVDEIEVYRGHNDMLSHPYHGAPIRDTEAHGTECAMVVRQIIQDAQDLQEQTITDEQLDTNQKKRLTSNLTEIISRAKDLFIFDIDKFQVVLPLNELHTELFQIQADLWRTQGRENITVWRTQTKWDPIRPTQPPVDSDSSINITMMSGEFRSEVFNISNAINTDLDMSISIKGLPGGTNPSYINVQEVEWTATVHGTAISSAISDIPVGPNGFIANIPAGMTRQVWLTLNPRSIPPGTYTGEIVIDGGNVGTFNIPIQLRLSPIEFPHRPTLSLGGWDYTNTTYGAITAENRDQMITTLKTFFVDTTWATKAVMPLTLSNQKAFSAFDAWVDRWPDARQYRIFLDVPSDFNGYQMGTQQFNKAVASWISSHVTHWRNKGINPAQVGLLLSDEPKTDQQAKLIIAWAKAISEVEPDLLIWEDPIFSDPSEGIEMAKACDVICLNHTQFMNKNEIFRDKYRQQINAGKALEFYSCSGPVDELDPYSYYLLQAWSCWKEDAAAMSFWSFATQGGTKSWQTDYPKKYRHSPLFIDPEAVTVGKAMFAIREGIEDFEYLTMLEKRIKQLEAAGDSPELVGRAKKRLSDMVDDVLPTVSEKNMIYWNIPKDRNIADHKRIEVLDILEELQTMGRPVNLHTTTKRSQSAVHQ